MGGGEFGQRVVVAEQPLAPGLQPPLLGARRGRLAVEGGERARIGSGVDLAHQPADVLHLAAPRLVAGDALRLEHRLEQVVGQRERVELHGGSSTSAAPSFCSSSTCLLFLRPADEFVVVSCIAGMIARHAEGSPLHLRARAARGIRAGGAGRAKRAGASACECEVSEGYGLSVTVRKGEPDIIEHNRDKGIGVTVYFGERPERAAATPAPRTSRPRRLRADGGRRGRHRAPHRRGRLRGPARAGGARARADWPGSTWTCSIPGTSAPRRRSSIARRCERAAFALSPKIRNSEGATVSAQHSQFVFANSLGFMDGFPTSRHYAVAAR